MISGEITVHEFRIKKVNFGDRNTHDATTFKGEFSAVISNEESSIKVELEFETEDTIDGCYSHLFP